MEGDGEDGIVCAERRMQTSSTNSAKGRRHAPLLQKHLHTRCQQPRLAHIPLLAVELETMAYSSRLAIIVGGIGKLHLRLAVEVVLILPQAVLAPSQASC